MLKESIDIKKLNELVKKNKADETITDAINNNEEKYKKAEKELSIISKELDKANKNLEEAKVARKAVSMFKIKEYAKVSKDLWDVKKIYKEKLRGKNELDNFCKERKDEILEIKNLVEEQYNIYQTNEIYIKAVKKIEKQNVELSPEFYASYINHVNEYINSKFSIGEETFLVAPNPEDLNQLLKVVKRLETKKQNKESSKITTNKKEKSVEPKKTENKVNKNVAKVEPKKEVTKKSTKTKVTAKKDDNKSKKTVATKKATEAKKSTEKKVTDKKKTVAEKQKAQISKEVKK